jgi:hypothetical protein
VLVLIHRVQNRVSVHEYLLFSLLASAIRASSTRATTTAKFESSAQSSSIKAISGVDEGTHSASLAKLSNGHDPVQEYEGDSSTAVSHQSIITPEQAKYDEWTHVASLTRPLDGKDLGKGYEEQIGNIEEGPAERQIPRPDDELGERKKAL